MEAEGPHSRCSYCTPSFVGCTILRAGLKKNRGHDSIPRAWPQWLSTAFLAYRCLAFRTASCSDFRRLWVTRGLDCSTVLNLAEKPGCTEPPVVPVPENVISGTLVL